MGGRSVEREVSFNSGRTVCDHLDTNKYEVIPLFQTEHGTLFILPWHFIHRGKIADFFHRLENEATKLGWDDLKNTVDFVYIALHGRYGEDGTIQGFLEVLGIPYLGTKVLGSAMGMDKVRQKELLKQHNIDVANGIVVNEYEVDNITESEIEAKMQAAGLNFPCIVKPSHEGSSFGVAFVKTMAELLLAVKNAAHASPQKTQAVLVEEKLEGMEFVCVTLQKTYKENGKIKREWFAFPITEVVPETEIYDYEQKYMPGRAHKVTPARCTPEIRNQIEQICTKATTVLDFSTISRIDGFATKEGKIILIDPNSLTGMGPASFLFHEAAEYGMSHTQLINFLIESELQNYGLVNMVDTNQSGEIGGAMQCVENDKKIRVAVLLGGDSNEREISLESGRNICHKLSPHKYSVTPMFVNDKMELFQLSNKLLIQNSTREITELLTPEIQVKWTDLPNICDFVFIGLHGGKGEGGAVQGTLEMLNLPYNGSGVLASALCMDKFKTNAFLSSLGFDVPKSILVAKTTWMNLDKTEKQNLLTNFVTEIGFPLILKPHDDGCSVMVKKATDMENLIVNVDEFFTSTKEFVLVEEFIKGMELTCGVFGNDKVVAMPPTMTVAKKEILSILEKFLPGDGENQTPAPLPKDKLTLVQGVMERAFKAVGCLGYARIDCFYQSAAESHTGKERVIILEFNTLPGMTPATCIFHQAAELGIRPMDFVEKIVQLGMERTLGRTKITETPKNVSEPVIETASEPQEIQPVIQQAATKQGVEATEEPTQPKKRKKAEMEASSGEPNMISFQVDDKYTMKLF